MAKPLKLKRSQAQEKRVAKQTGGRTQPQSGAGAFRKEDVRSSRFLIQCKGTTNLDAKTMVLKGSDLDACEQNAALDGREPCLQLDLGRRHWFAVPEWVAAGLGLIDA